ncbi:hypothetical protein C5167_007167 [Papaver somniferum]|uniref:X8 domain-containing protein n=1 Tax=Papaver somniferum TaxID=3469 RepID=A0A4Y7JFL6_PAPSO|nr:PLASMODESMATA CALLOSE-BINDING PROTEIN 2-like [Papaver somniferum]RZC59863.1 hypothetical protein C5167_007167 [Papaver somniferum]
MSVVLVLPLLIIFAFTSHSADAVWCACRPDQSDVVLQKAIDYACGNGADCSAINQGGVCYQPNTVRAHCSYAVNSYYQKKGGAQGSCEFSGSAAVTSTDPSPGGSCTFTSGGGGGGGGGGGVTVNPPSTTSPPGSTTPTGGSSTPGGSTMTPGSTTTPGSSSSTFSPPGSLTNGNGGMMGGGFGTGLGPSGTGSIDTSDGGTVLKNTNYVSLLLTVWFSALLFLWV